jgi:hypothetical protein
MSEAESPRTNYSNESPLEEFSELPDAESSLDPNDPGALQDVMEYAGLNEEEAKELLTKLRNTLLKIREEIETNQD